MRVFWETILAQLGSGVHKAGSRVSLQQLCEAHSADDLCLYLCLGQWSVRRGADLLRWQHPGNKVTSLREAKDGGFYDVLCVVVFGKGKFRQRHDVWHVQIVPWRQTSLLFLGFVWQHPEMGSFEAKGIAERRWVLSHWPLAKRLACWPCHGENGGDLDQGLQ